MGLFDWLKFKKKPAPTANPWQVGARVLAKYSDSYFYPGQVRDVQGDGCFIVYDDGHSSWVHHAHVLAPDLKVGSKVFCRVRGGPMFAPGVINQQKGESIQIRYDHGEEEWSSISMLRVQRPIANIDASTITGPLGTPPKQNLDLGPPVKDSNWRVGDRVLARWLDFFWYPGTILAMGERGIHVLFDDADQRIVQEAMLMPLVLEEGEHIEVRPKNEPQRIYVPAVVQRVHGEMLDVDLEDGTQESNLRVTRVRLWRCPANPSAFTFEEGDRVLAYDSDDFVYPAEIVAIQDEQRILVQYLDGPERPLTPELIRRFEVRPGLRVECRWSGAPHYFPGTIAKVDGERLHVKYEDGDDEWTNIRLIRIPPKKPV
jgi:hypothetical protein